MSRADQLTHRLRNLLTVVQGAADVNTGADYALISAASREAIDVLCELERELGLRDPERGATPGEPSAGPQRA
jgi:hypothetical protein